MEMFLAIFVLNANVINAMNRENSLKRFSIR